MRETVVKRSPCIGAVGATPSGRKHRNQPRTCCPYLVSAVLAITGLIFGGNRAVAERGYPPCNPPQTNEYLLLVVTNNEQSQQQILSALPTQGYISVCNYLNDVVTRVGGFGTLEDANYWAQYINKNLGLPAFVARPGAASIVPFGSAATLPQSDRAYNPLPLGTGYAVLVDYSNQPAIAGDLQQFLKRPVGLVSYGQRPYLLAEYTTNQGTANRLLQTLSDRGFLVMVVDGRNVLLLRSVVSFP